MGKRLSSFAPVSLLVRLGWIREGFPIDVIDSVFKLGGGWSVVRRILNQ